MVGGSAATLDKAVAVMPWGTPSFTVVMTVTLAANLRIPFRKAAELLSELSTSCGQLCSVVIFAWFLPQVKSLCLAWSAHAWEGVSTPLMSLIENRRSQ